MKKFKFFMCDVCLVSLIGTSVCGCGKKSDDKSEKKGKKRDTEVTEISETESFTEETSSELNTDVNGGAQLNTDTNGGPMTISPDMTQGPGEPTETTLPTIDIDSYDWEAAYTWDGTQITGLVEPIPEEVKNTGVLVIPGKCETIKNQAFKDTSWLKEVKFEEPEKVTMIGDSAFARCPQLHSFVMPPHSNQYEMKLIQQNFMLFGARGKGNATRIYNMVMPDCEVHNALLTYLSDTASVKPAYNQTFLQTLYCPKNFSVSFETMVDHTLQTFAKYSKEFMKKNYPDELDITNRYYDKPFHDYCT